jgi:hypothetical protein
VKKPNPKTLSGGHDPREMARRSAEKRRANKAAGTTARKSPTIDDARAILWEIAENKNSASSSRVQAAAILEKLGEPEKMAEWRNSAQVQPGYTPPTWKEVLDFAKSIGAY